MDYSKEEDLIPFDNNDQTISISEYPGQMASIAWNASFSKSLLENNKSVCIQTNSIPAGHDFGVMYNPWEGEIQITNKTIDGKEYMVLTGYPSSMSFDQIMAGIGNFDTMDFAIELNIGMY